ncbi:hypothetical protein I6N96_12600 [Enterococcus sp. BWM-S5]|uniref:Uncharacterized protein n=1 Tax=Enterococcus larvae TaxID=2794352 RepID=A0ABS4CKV3_9ENTE|nr:hypothetical protein [Enterococcus larvae]MBP1047113.1 hypothetical protein [Enterococcus larvae]
MIINILGAIANLTSLILWVPQAKTTWKNRNNIQALSGVSIATQIIVAINTILWCVYGLLISNIWLPLGTIIILPLATLTIFLKLKSTKEKPDDVESRSWFTFSDYKKLSVVDKERCLRAIYSADFHKYLKHELLNWESYEMMSDLEKMYWDRELWAEKKTAPKKGIDVKKK